MTYFSYSHTKHVAMTDALFFCAVNASQCSACPGGSFCGDSGLTAASGPCNAGFWCSVGSAHPNASECDSRGVGCSSGCGGICPKGTYCPRGSALPTPCPQASSQCGSSMTVLVFVHQATMSGKLLLHHITRITSCV